MQSFLTPIHLPAPPNMLCAEESPLGGARSRGGPSDFGERVAPRGG